ncbi:MAG: DUF1801 domain-containing protein [Gammaproteobacteria bacterium]|nr:DUF1801 domain-containing protein [Gammaproteobacteria bacterium]
MARSKYKKTRKGTPAPANAVMRFPNAVQRDPAIEKWFDAQPAALGTVARYWFGLMRECDPGVKEILHDGHPTACLGEAAFAYVNAFSSHVNVGFFRGADLPDPKRMLEGGGRFMRHVKVKPGQEIDDEALRKLIAAACSDMQQRLGAGD